jgi:protein-S-isoprenylcysteine O-methyltransferase Ste14
MYLLATSTCLAALASFAWGMFCFFSKPSALTWRAGAVAVLGTFFGSWHVHAIAAATVFPWFTATGVVAHLVSIGIFWSAMRACRSHRPTAIFEADMPVCLLETGPYRYVRHPFYSAYTIFWLGGWVASGSGVALLSLVVMAAIYGLGARQEEHKFMRSPLAPRYAMYRRRVGWWPRVRVLRKPLLTGD